MYARIVLLTIAIMDKCWDDNIDPADVCTALSSQDLNEVAMEWAIQKVAASYIGRWFFTRVMSREMLHRFLIEE